MAGIVIFQFFNDCCLFSCVGVESEAFLDPTARYRIFGWLGDDKLIGYNWFIDARFKRHNRYEHGVIKFQKVRMLLRAMSNMSYGGIDFKVFL